MPSPAGTPRHGASSRTTRISTRWLAASAALALAAWSAGSLSRAQTGGEGRFEIRTIRPAGYPRSDLPAHIHLEIAPPGDDQLTLVTEIRFDDDPHITPEAKEESRNAGWPVVPTARGAGGIATVEAAFTLPSMTK